MSVTPSRPFEAIRLSNVSIPATTLTRIGNYSSIKDQVRLCHMTTQSIREMSQALNHWPRWTDRTVQKIVGSDRPVARRSNGNSSDYESDSVSSGSPQLIRQLSALARISCVTFEGVFKAVKTYRDPRIVNHLVAREGGFEKFLEMVDSIPSKETREKLLCNAMRSPLSLEVVQNCISKRSDKTQLIEMILSGRSGLSVYCALSFLDLFEDTDSPKVRERIVQQIIGRVGYFRGDECTERQLREVVNSIKDRENFLPDFMQLKRQSTCSIVSCSDGRSGKECEDDLRERFPSVVFKSLKESDPKIVYKFVSKQGGLTKLLEIAPRIPCDYTRIEILGEALSCPDISLEEVHTILQNRKAAIAQSRKDWFRSGVRLEDDIIPILQKVISDREGLSFDDAFRLLDALRQYPSQQMIHCLIKKDGGLEKFLERVEKEPSEHNQIVFRSHALSCPALSFEDAQKIVRNQEDKIRFIFGFRELSYVDAIQCFQLFNHSSEDRENIAKRILERFRILSVNQLAAFLNHLEDPAKFFRDFLGSESGYYNRSDIVLRLSILVPELLKIDSKYKGLEEVISILIDSIDEQEKQRRGPYDRSISFSEYAKRPLGNIREIVLEKDTSFDQVMSITKRFPVDKKEIALMIIHRDGLSFDEAFTLLDLFNDQPNDLMFIAERVLKKLGLFPFDRVVRLLDRFQDPKRIIDFFIQQGYRRQDELPNSDYKSIVKLHALLEENAKYKELALVVQKDISRSHPHTSECVKDQAMWELAKRRDLSFEQATNIANKITDLKMRLDMIKEISTRYSLRSPDATKYFDLFKDPSEDREKTASNILGRFSLLSVGQLGRLLDQLEDPQNFFRDFIGKENHLRNLSNIVLHLSILVPELVKMNSKYKYLEEQIPLLIDQINQLENKGGFSRSMRFTEYAGRPLEEVKAIVLDTDTSFDQVIGITERFPPDKKEIVSTLILNRYGLSFEEGFKLLDLFKDQPDNQIFVAELLLKRLGIFPFDQVVRLLDRFENPKAIIDFFIKSAESRDFEKSIVQLRALLEVNTKYRELAREILFNFEDGIIHSALEILEKRTDLSLEQSAHIENKKSNLRKQSKKISANGAFFYGGLRNDNVSWDNI